MCKYCNHLKELRKSDKELYEGLIEKWKLANLRQEKLLKQSYSFMNSYEKSLRKDGIYSFSLNHLLVSIRRELFGDIV